MTQEMPKSSHDEEPGIYADVISFIRKKYAIPSKYKSYLCTDYSFGQRIQNLKYSLINFEHIEVEKSHFNKFRIDGIIKGAYYKLVSIRINGNYHFLIFTNDLKKFEKEFFSAKVKRRTGIYRIEHTSFGPFLQLINLKNVVKPILNEDLFTEISTEINNFMKKEEVYKQNNLDYKRGILLYGLPGNGKSCFVKHLLKNIKCISIICESKSDQDLDFVYNFLNDDTLISYYKIIVMEDIDKVEGYMRGRVLNLIDGILPLHKVLFIATTNKPQDLDPAITNRPSRFDSLYEIASPNEESRRTLLSGFFKGDISKAVKETDGFRGAYFKEIFLITQLYECSLSDAIIKLKKKFKAYKEFKADEYIS